MLYSEVINCPPPPPPAVLLPPQWIGRIARQLPLNWHWGSGSYKPKTPKREYPFLGRCQHKAEEPYKTEAVI